MADAVLKDHQFELDGFAFGLGLPFEVREDGFDTGSPEWTTQDGVGYGTGATLFGRDALTGPTWGFTGFVNCRSEEEALAALNDAGKAWRARQVRESAGAFSTLRYAVGGRTRRVYGRPRRFSAPPTNLILGGMVPIVADFKTADALHYDDVEQVASLNLDLSPGVPGYRIPFTMPLTFTGPTVPHAGAVVVGGAEETPAIVTFYGPCSGAWLTIDGVRVAEITGQLRYDESVTIDARPWVNTVRNQAGANVPGMLSRKTFLSNLRLSPGPVALGYSAVDATGRARVEVRWRSAWPTL